jgi:hypothetical protein
MKRLHLSVFVVVVLGSVIYGSEAKPSGMEQQQPQKAASPAPKGLTTEAANEAERKREFRRSRRAQASRAFGMVRDTAQ